MSTTMLRYNSGKPPLSLLPTALIVATAFDADIMEMPVKLLNDTALVLDFGAKKYSANNWRKGGSWLSVLDCAFRHLHKIIAGETHDLESGIHHAAHVQCNLGFLSEFISQETGDDDRFKVENRYDITDLEGDYEPSINIIYGLLLLWKDGDTDEALAIAVYLLALWYEDLDDEERMIIVGTSMYAPKPHQLAVGVVTTDALRAGSITHE